MRKAVFEQFVVAEFFAVVTTLLIQLKIVRVDQQFGDMAQLSEVLDNIANRGWGADQIVPSLLAFINSGLETAPASVWAHNPLPAPPVHEQNLLQFHEYAIFYPLAQLVHFLPSNFILLSIYVLSFTVALLIVYVAIRKAGLPIVAAAAFCLLVIFHPAWSEGLRGQFYPDRIFVSAGLLFMVLTSMTTRRVPLVLASLLCLSIDERAAITAGLFLAAYVVLYWRSRPADRLFRLALAACLVMYGLVVVKFFLPINIYDSGFLPTNIAILVNRFALPTFRENALLFMAINAPFLLVAIFFEWRAAAIAFVLMLPNLIGNIGGAEKVGWGTHYHDEYLPAVLWAALCGFIAAWRRLSGPKRDAVAFGSLCLAIVFLVIVNPYTGRADRGWSSNAFVAWFPRDVRTYDGAVATAGAQQEAAFAAAIPEHTLVSTVEAGMPFLYSNRTLELYPLGIDKADYAVFVRSSGLGLTGTYSGAVSFLDPTSVARINAALVQRMQRDGYDFDHPVAIGSGGLIALKRKASAP